MHPVLVLQPKRHDLELQLPDGAQDQLIVAQRPEQLRGALLAQLRQPLLQRLHLERILQHRAPEDFRCETRHAGERQPLALSEGVADVDGAVVVQPDDVARVGLLGVHAIGGHEGERVRHAHLLVEPHVEQPHAARVLARAQAQKRDPVAVRRIHVGLDLEHEAGERALRRFDDALARRARQRSGRVGREGAQQLLDAEVVDGRTEEHRRLLAGQVGGGIETLGRAAHQLRLLHEGPGLLAEKLLRRIARERVDDAILADAAALTGGVDVDAILDEMVDAAQLAPHADRPGDRGGADAQHALDLVQQLDRRAAVAVELVDEGHDRRIAQPADLHQLDGALLHPLGAVDHHERRVDRGQRAVGVLGEVLVTRGVEQVHDAVAVRELHHRGSDGDAALLLEPHPVGGRMARGLATLDGACHLDRTAEQQQFLGERGLARVGVRDDRKSSSFLYFFSS